MQLVVEVEGWTLEHDLHGHECVLGMKNLVQLVAISSLALQRMLLLEVTCREAHTPCHHCCIHQQPQKFAFFWLQAQLLVKDHPD